jgi:hypothetical protein
MTATSNLPLDSGVDFPWVRSEDNAWNIAVLDLRRVALTAVSATLDPAVAESFSRHRTGEEYSRVELPVEIPVHARIALPLATVERDGAVAVAAQMEDKWNVYAHGDRLFFARSWTGELVYSAVLQRSDGVAMLTSIQAPDTDADRGHVVREIDYLVESYVLGYAFPHPLPPSLGRSLEAVVAYSWSRHGRRGLFATYDDSLAAAHPRESASDD